MWNIARTGTGNVERCHKVEQKGNQGLKTSIKAPENVSQKGTGSFARRVSFFVKASIRLFNDVRWLLSSSHRPLFLESDSIRCAKIDRSSYDPGLMVSSCS